MRRTGRTDCWIPCFWTGLTSSSDRSSAESHQESAAERSGDTGQMPASGEAVLCVHSPARYCRRIPARCWPLLRVPASNPDNLPRSCPLVQRSGRKRCTERRRHFRHHRLPAVCGIRILSSAGVSRPQGPSQNGIPSLGFSFSVLVKFSCVAVSDRYLSHGILLLYVHVVATSQQKNGCRKDSRRKHLFSCAGCPKVIQCISG